MFNRIRVKNKEQLIYIIGAILLLSVLYFAFDNKPSTQKTLETSRGLTFQEFDITGLTAEARKSLNPDETGRLETLETQAQHATTDTARVNTLKQLSGYWYQLQYPVIAGLYAKEIAEKDSTAASWAITGTTFAAALQQKELEEKRKLFARDQALAAFENAISLEPEVIDHRINQALCYIEVPKSDEPMKGIQMLAGLAAAHPESPLPPYHLARLAVRTGQYERARTRIEQALKLDPSDPEMACLAVDIYTALNKTAEVQKWTEVCAGKK